MAYDGNNLSLMVQGRGTASTRWQYKSADPIATVNTAGYISDATTRGLKVLDIVEVIDTATPTFNTCLVIAITSGAADLTDGVTLTLTNSD